MNRAYTLRVLSAYYRPLSDGSARRVCAELVSNPEQADTFRRRHAAAETITERFDLPSSVVQK